MTLRYWASCKTSGFQSQSWGMGICSTWSWGCPASSSWSLGRMTTLPPSVCDFFETHWLAPEARP